MRLLVSVELVKTRSVGNGFFITASTMHTQSNLQSSQQTTTFKSRKVVGYARVSTDLQREKESIKTQLELIERYCEQNGLTLVETICDDGVSGTIPLPERAGGAKLLQNARAGKFAAVVVYKADRLGRDTLVNEQTARTLYDELGIDIVGIAERIDLATPIGRAMFTFQSAIGRLERENTLQRSRDATLRLAREGCWLGGIVPYGFRIEGKDRNARLVISEAVDAKTDMCEADVVREIFRLSGEEGWSNIRIAKHLNELGVATTYVKDGREIRHKAPEVRGKRANSISGQWRPGAVLRLLNNTTYKGVHIWGKRRKTKTKEDHAVIERAVPAIVSAELWEAAQRTLQSNRLARPDIEKRQYMLRGLMLCSHCRLKFSGTVSNSRPVRDSDAAGIADGSIEVRSSYVLKRYYECSGKNMDRGLVGVRCISKSPRAVEIESLVWEQLEGFVYSPEVVLDELREKLRDCAGDSAALERKLKDVESQKAANDGERAALFRLFRKGTISEADLEAQMAEMVEEEKALTAEVERLQNEFTHANNATVALDNAAKLLQKLRKKLEADAEQNGGENSWEAKRRVVELLVEEIVVTGKLAKVTYSFEAGNAAMSVWRSLQLGAKVRPTFEEKVGERVGEWLEAQPELLLEELIDKTKRELGVSSSRAGMCRLRAKLGYAPDNHHSRMARLAVAKMVEKANSKTKTGR